MTAPRHPKATIDFIDVYCRFYQDLFPEVRSFESFKILHFGMLSSLKRKSLPEIAQLAGLENSQSLHHFLTESPWETAALKHRRLEGILAVLAGRPITLIIDETGDAKAGHKTDYVKRQYLGNLGKVENGIVAVTAYGVIADLTFPLTFRVYKPRERLKAGDEYQSKPEIAAAMIRELQALGFKIDLVLADSLYGESHSNFISVLEELKLNYVVAIRSNHSVWLPMNVKVRASGWQRFERIFANGEREERYIREIIFGQRGPKRYWQITTDVATLPAGATWWVMTKVPGIKYRAVGNLFGLRTWVEYGLKQRKDELGWADFRLTAYESIEKWWEIICSAYLLVSLHSAKLNQLSKTVPAIFAEHGDWDRGQGWKNYLNNLRLIMQPLISFNLIKPWLAVFPVRQLVSGFSQLIAFMNRFATSTSPLHLQPYFAFSSA